MPILEKVGEATKVRVSASAPLELMWILHNLQAKHVLNGPYTSLERLRADMQPKVASFWADGVRGYTETIVLAERSGTTLDLDLDRYFEKLDEAIEMVDGGLSLLSERPSERTAFQTRPTSGPAVRSWKSWPNPRWRRAAWCCHRGGSSA